MLSPEAKASLSEALDAVLAQLGDDPESDELRDHLEAATAVLGGDGASEAPGDEPDEETPDEAIEGEGDEEDAYDFEKAREKFTERRSGKKDAAE